MSHDNGYGKRCPDCGEPMSNMPSLNLRQCATGCKNKHDWKLAEGLAPLFTESRDRGIA
ncbi:hypothetical protein [Pseudomonas sp. LBUM920]|uniref:hypothetical protein n=1 Tax=Pseudomonas sp. LBUM920 TaxID=2126069 RepID=UPI000F7032AA|nr:hypothetical protein [Pseudomonas sp. LBUM920]AZF63764.1 hypothetical protein C4J83_2775 [Pseudomonas sp. LBUM920]